MVFSIKVVHHTDLGTKSVQCTELATKLMFSLKSYHAGIYN